jgi:hypothetical protein
VLFAALWLTAATLLIKPGPDDRDRAGRHRPGGPRSQAADVGQEPAPTAG